MNLPDALPPIPIICLDCGKRSATPAIHATHDCAGRACDMPYILTEAAKLISGPRRESYGPVEESFERVATVASVLLARKLSAPLDGKDVAMFMVAMKLCREANQPAHDNRLDAIGYLALLDQLHTANPSPSHGQTTT